MEQILAALRATADPSRLRLLALCADDELTVSDLVEILGQSQPRVSRHLKILCDAGLLERVREGAWVFCRLASRGVSAELVRRVLAVIPPNDAVRARDNAGLSAIKNRRAAAAAAYFRDNAPHWADLRSLHVDEAEVEAALRRAVADRPIGDLLDIGTGTGRILEVLGPLAERGEGVDTSREMLAIARSRLADAGLANCMVHQADMYHLPHGDASMDLVTIHQVLHFAQYPAQVLAEAARVLKAGGRLAVVDFAPHEQEALRTEHNHRRLGFADGEVAAWCAQAGLAVESIRSLPGQPLTVTLWLATKPAAPSTQVPSLIPSIPVIGGEA